MAARNVGTATSSGYSTADRWEHNASGGSLDLSQQALTVGQTDIPAQFKYFMRVACTTGNNNAGIWQKIEDVTSVQGTVTVSFYAKGTNPNGGSFQLNIRQYFGSSGSTEVDQNETFTVTSSWQRFTFTIQMQDISGKTISGGNDYVWVYFRQPDTDTSTNAWTLDFTGVQLEAGSTASDFEFEDYGTTLQKCQRYYYKLYKTQSNQNIGNASTFDTSGVYIVLSWPTTMRGNPTVTASSAGDFSILGQQLARTATGFSSGHGSPFNVQLNFNYSSGLTSGYAYWVRMEGGSEDNTKYIEADAEL